MDTSTVDSVARRPEVERAAAPSSPVVALRSTSVDDFLMDVADPMAELADVPCARVSHGWWLPETATDGQLLYFVQCSLPDDVVFAAETAAAVYGVDVRPQSRAFSPFRVCVSRRGRGRALRRPGIYCRSLDVDDEEVVECGGLRMTSAVRTVFDVACSSPLERAVWVVECFCRMGLVTLGELWEFARAHRGRRGVRVFREALRLADVASESPQETAVRLRLLEAGFVGVRSQVRVQRRCGAHFRVDLGVLRPRVGDEAAVDRLVVPGSRGIAIEYDGVQFHPTSGVKWREDRERLRELKSLGWLPIVVHSSDLWGDRPTFEYEVADAMRRLWGVEHRVSGVRRRWGLTRMNRVRNAWSRRVEPWWRVWDGGRAPRSEVRV